MMPVLLADQRNSLEHVGVFGMRKSRFHHMQEWLDLQIRFRELAQVYSLFVCWVYLFSQAFCDELANVVLAVGVVPVYREEELTDFLPKVLPEVVDHVRWPDDSSIDVLVNPSLVILLKRNWEINLVFLLLRNRSVLFDLLIRQITR